MTPPMPSMSVTSVRSLIVRHHATSASNGIPRCSRAAAISGDSGAVKRHGLTASRFAEVTSRPCARSSDTVSLPSLLEPSKPDATGLSACTRYPAALSSATSLTVTNVLPISVPDDVTKIVVMRRAAGVRPPRAPQPALRCARPRTSRAVAKCPAAPSAGESLRRESQRCAVPCWPRARATRRR